jgi:hypothetical protein
MLFYQGTAPTGWTKVTTHTNKALRVVDGTGGGSGGTESFTTVFSSKSISGTVGNRTLATSQIPKHTHTMRNTASDNLAQGPVAKNIDYISNTGNQSATGETGGDGAHNHGFTGGSIDLRVQYIDVIICSKD